MSNVKNYALVTGGSSGIGLALSRLFAKAGYNLFIVSKLDEELSSAREELTAAYPEITIETLQKDLSLQGSAAEVYAEAKERDLCIDVLVNNAGFATSGYTNQIDAARELSMINLNVVALYHLTRLFMGDMLEADRGRILNVASTAGFSPIPCFNTYAATKAFSLHFSEALSYELKQQKSSVTVTTLCPPPVKTGFQAAADMGQSKLFDSFYTMEPDVVAKRAFNALFKGQPVIVPSVSGNLIQGLLSCLPKSWRYKQLMKMV